MWNMAGKTVKINKIRVKRRQLAKRIKEAEGNYNAGRVKKGNVKDLLKDLAD
jgi:hypothetical protein